jgi:hypothetical protein
MKNKLVVLLLLLSFTGICQEKITAEIINTTIIKADTFIGLDAYNYQYFIANKTFIKIKNLERFEYKNVSLGTITRIDIQNPLKIIIFYQDFNTVIILDNQLNEIQKINFNLHIENINATAVGNALQNNLWVYNSNKQQIGLYNYLKNTFKYISSPKTDAIKFYQTNNNAFFWINKDNYSFSCDIFGKITALGKVPDFDDLQFISNVEIVFKKNNILLYTNVNLGNQKILDIDQKSINNFYFKDQNLAIFTSEEIINYKIKIP